MACSETSPELTTPSALHPEESLYIRVSKSHNFPQILSIWPEIKQSPSSSHTHRVLPWAAASSNLPLADRDVIKDTPHETLHQTGRAICSAWCKVSLRSPGNCWDTALPGDFYLYLCVGYACYFWKPRIYKMQLVQARLVFFKDSSSQAVSKGKFMI